MRAGSVKRRFHRGLGALLVAVVLGAPWPAGAQSPEPRALTIATGVPGGAYHPLGAAICRLINLDERSDGLRCLSESSKGSVANIRALLRHERDFGIAQADMEEAAVAGSGPFAQGGPQHGLRAVLALHVEAFTIMARGDAGIARFQDLRGKRIGVGEVGSGQHASKDVLLAAFGWTLADFKRVAELNPVEQNKELCAGRLDAVFFFAGNPNGLVQDATARCGARLVAVDGPEIARLIESEQFYGDAVIPGGLYRGNPQDTPTLGAHCLLLTTDAVAEADVYALVKAVVEHFDDFRLLHPVLAGLQPRDLVPHNLAAPLHAGAERYFREAGLLK